MTTCIESHTLLVELVFGHLDDASEARLQEHLLSCAECRIEERRLLDLAEAADGDVIEPRPELRARLSAAFHEANWERHSILRRRVPAWVAVAAALAGALIVALLPRAPERVVRRDSAPAERLDLPLVQEALPFVIAGAHDTWVPSDSARGVRSRRRTSGDSL